jgi:hypothetical protein
MFYFKGVKGEKNIMNCIRRFSAIVFICVLVCAFLFCQKDTSPIVNPPDEPDTTSHEFIWDYTIIDSPFDYGIFYDVAIINENDIWVVGRIYSDSLNSIRPYNAIHWTGSEWQLVKIKFNNTCGGVDYPTITSIWAFSSNHILFSNGGEVATFDGIDAFADCDMNPLLNGAIRKIFAFGTNNIYLIGNSGTIVHFNGSLWEKLDSGTNTSINDIWGEKNQITQKEKILATVSDRYSSGEYRLLSISQGGVTDTLNWDVNRRLQSVWFKESSPVYVCGSGLFFKNTTQWKNIDISPYYLTSIRGTVQNDILVVGAFGSVAHFNGSTWHHYNELILSDGTLEALAYKDKTAIAVGQIGTDGLILVGKK